MANANAPQTPSAGTHRRELHAPIHDPRVPSELHDLSHAELTRQFDECTRNLSYEQLRSIESGRLAITGTKSPKLRRAIQLHLALQYRTHS
jgi:hypothetical protein